MPLTPHTVRFSEDEWEAIASEASRSGLTAGQFVRSSALARAAFSFARRGGTAAGRVADLLAHADRLVRDSGSE